ncbi:MAG: GNAT family N-acetyltransferase [Bacillota bacterium]
MKNIKQQLKALYKECFSDSDECVEYLFCNRLGIHNARYEMLNNEIVAEMFLVKKLLKYKNKEISTPFVVGLCTKTDYRKKGIALRLMKKSLINLQSAFVMLYPAVKGFYEKMDFATISYDNILTHDYMMHECDYPQRLLDIYNLYNKDKDFYIKLDLKGFEQKIAIAKKDNGGFFVLEKGGKIKGFTNKDESIVLNQLPEKSGVMARVVDLKKAFELSGLSINTKIMLTDSLIEKNNINFYVDKGKVIETNDFDLKMSISELTLHFFGLGSKLKQFDKLNGHILERY